jgi:hypothetical protein
MTTIREDKRCSFPQILRVKLSWNFLILWFLLSVNPASSLKFLTENKKNVPSKIISGDNSKFRFNGKLNRKVPVDPAHDI